ncbi:T9SS type A sorting domain-containing protein [Candidatus Fermentibacteria bacterium]|nr:T9SS type A sorting domain-containing protein [Candidatus Fermentibacteria bacterium]
MRLVICGAAVLLGAVGPTVANPVVEQVFSELTFDVIGWRLEMTPWEELSTWFLTTMSDTAEFRPDVPLEDYLVVTQDDLLRPLRIDPQGDTLRIWKPEWFPNLPVDELIFGTVEGAFIASPPPGYSISTSLTFYYLDASPTMGAPNDSLNAMGDIHGIVTDSLGTPMEGVRVVYGNDIMGNPIFAMTDETGEFRIHNYARLQYMSVQAEECPIELTSVQIWPDTTVEMSIALDCEMGAEPWEGPAYHLLATKPNPFASGTSFLYALPTPADVRVAVYDARGALVKILFEGRQSAGRHTVTWDASDIPSGTYVCRLTTPRAVLTTRCILAR